MTGAIGHRPHQNLSRRGLLRRAAVVTAAPLLLACGSPARQAAATVSLSIVGIITSDMSRSLRFYRLLGLDVPSAVAAGTDSYRLRMSDGHVLFWETPEAINAFDPAWAQPPAGDRRVVLEFGFESRVSLDAAFRALTAAGSPRRLAPFQLSRDVRYAIVVDPDGNQVALRHPATG